VVRRWDRQPRFEKATCKRSLCPEGTLGEDVRPKIARRHFGFGGV